MLTLRRPEAILHDELSTPELIRRIADDRDKHAFASLFGRFAPRLAGFFREAGLPDDVRDELVQEVLLRVWRGASRYEPHKASVETWIFAIARNARIDHFRRPATRARVEPLDPAFVDDSMPHAEEEAVRRERAHELHQALGSLPREQAAILEAAYFQHKTLRTIATEGGIALGTVKSRVRLAFARLRAALGSQT